MIEADLAEFAHVNLDDVWLGKVSVRHVNVCVEQQMNNPRSRLFVAARGGNTRWIGHSEDTEVLAGIYDLLAALVKGFGGNAAAWPRIATPTPAFAPTVAEFNPAKFLSLINGG